VHMTQQEPDFHAIRRIYLIGMMGVGKSTTARLLAQHLKWAWIDTDDCVERQSGISISEIFTRFGEEEFRRREWNCVKQTEMLENVIVACGGGAPCYHNAMDLMMASGYVVFLDATFEHLEERLSTETSTRPLLGEPGIVAVEQLKRLYGIRESVYRRAHDVINTSDLSESEVVDAMIHMLSEREDQLRQSM